MTAIGPSQHDVLLSYSTLDLATVQSVVAEVRGLGYTVWIDQEQVRPGDQFLAKVYAGMDRSSCILLAISANFVNSPWCRDELISSVTEQVRRGRRVLPLLLDDTKPDDLPTILSSRRLITRQELARSLRDMLGPPRFWQLDGREGRTSPVRGFQEPDLTGLKPREIRFRPAMPFGLFVDTAAETNLEALIESLARVGGPAVSFLILGEAGIGKTTVANYIYAVLRARLDRSSRPQVVPRLIRLGERTAEEVIQALDAATSDDLIGTAEETGYPVLLILDGLNEAPGLLDRILKTSAIAASRPHLRLLVTSRPAPSVNRLLELDMEIDAARLQALRIERWTPRKVERYFHDSGLSALYAGLRPEVADALRLPLLASLLIRRLEDATAPPSLRTVIDVFDYIVEDSVQRISAGTARDDGSIQPRQVLEKLALAMTQRELVTIEGSSLAELLALGTDLPAFVEAAVHSGILRTVEPIAHLSSPLGPDQLQPVRFSFVHQAIQEFLTASAIQAKSPRFEDWLGHLPKDVCQDSYFREIPLYFVELLDSPLEREKLVDHFRVDGDLLTAARTVQAIGDPGITAKLITRISDDVRASIGRPSFYPWASETLRVLGAAGHQDIIDFVTRAGVVEELYSEPEARISGVPVDQADEVTWRIVGRSIVFLSEMGQSKWLEVAGGRLGNIMSPHFMYHVGESLTLLAEAGGQPELIRRTAGGLRENSLADPVSDAYAQGALSALGDGDLSIDTAAPLEQLLRELASSSRQHYVDEFFRRAHGIDALGQVGAAAQCVLTITELVDRELFSIREGISQVGSHTPVLSSAIQSVMRCCRRFPESSADWRGLLERLFMSADLAENSWLLGHTSRLLIAHFRSAADLAWLESWRSSSQITPAVKKMINGVLWYGGR